MYEGGKKLNKLEEEEDQYKPKTECSFYSNNYFVYISNDNINKNLSLKESLGKINIYFRDIIIDHQKFATWKIQLKIAINFISSKDAEKERLMQPTSDNKKLIFHNDANKVVDELFDSLISRYQGNLESSMKGSEFIFPSLKMIS